MINQKKPLSTSRAGFTMYLRGHDRYIPKKQVFAALNLKVRENEVWCVKSQT